jgi:hypothetical protein
VPSATNTAATQAILRFQAHQFVCPHFACDPSSRSDPPRARLRTQGKQANVGHVSGISAVRQQPLMQRMLFTSSSRVRHIFKTMNAPFGRHLGLISIKKFDRKTEYSLVQAVVYRTFPSEKEMNI